MQFTYFIPAFPKQIAETADLDAIGLAHVHDGQQPKSMRGRLGDVDGLFVAVADDVAGKGHAAEIAYKILLQTWRAAPAVDGKVPYHVGFWNDRRPTGDTLLRRNPIDGRPVTLLDGAEWLVPVGFGRSTAMTLPLVLDLNDEGKWVGRTDPGYAEFCATARTAHDTLLAGWTGEASTLNFSDAMRIVVPALAARYRVGAVELATLALVGNAEIGEVMAAVCDFEEFKATMSQRMAEQATA